MIWWCVRGLMETSPSQSAGQGGGAQWSLQTGYPTVVTDCFHQGGSQAHRGNAHRGRCQPSWYLSVGGPTSLGRARNRQKAGRRGGERSLAKGGQACIKSFQCTAPDWPCTLCAQREKEKGSVGYGAKRSRIWAWGHVFLQHASQQPIAALMQQQTETSPDLNEAN